MKTPIPEIDILRKDISSLVDEALTGGVEVSITTVKEIKAVIMDARKQLSKEYFEGSMDTLDGVIHILQEAVNRRKKS